MALAARPKPQYKRLHIDVGGAVQGVGFRPFVHRTATELALAGWVMNSPAGVVIEVEGEPARLEAFVAAVHGAPPVSARVTRLSVREQPAVGESGFSIRASRLEGPRLTQIPRDLATCRACLAELFDPVDRRWRYPFINCTQCGPRFSIMEAMPYDRARTSMRRFEMCEACEAEYEDPSSRRFHAEPNACPDCGPRLSLVDGGGRRLAWTHAALMTAADWIREGRIVAVKGIGGFHLLADAGSTAAVQRLRERKRRPHKPFAVMFPDLDALARACLVSDAERALVCAPEAPIVLMRRRGDSVAEAVAPGNPWIGAILPYAPLHHLLLRELAGPVLATSGNLADEPIAIETAEALERLGGVADVFLTHDRPIVRPVEDSLMRIACGRPLMLRRARGYAPEPLAVAGAEAGVLASGGHLKTTVAITQKGRVTLWPHIGDLETAPARDAHLRAMQDISRLCDIDPLLTACDLHPDYASGRASPGLAPDVLPVQHHLAHVAACLADNGLEPPALGVAWDGAGYGTDGTLWGGEFLSVDDAGWRRVARLRPFPLPGGAAAIREPRRAALGLLWTAFGRDALAMDDLAPVASFTPAERRTLAAMLERGLNTPVCSSAGRLFDAVAALAGLRQRSSYEGQAAAELEWAAGDRDDGRCYQLQLHEMDGAPGLVLDWGPALEHLLADVRAGAQPGQVSEALHNGLAAAIVAVAARIGEPRVALTGGCFQNLRLTETTVAALRRAGFEPLWHQWIPPNDGGLALGQAVWASWTRTGGCASCA